MPCCQHGAFYSPIVGLPTPTSFPSRPLVWFGQITVVVDLRIGLRTSPRGRCRLLTRWWWSRYSLQVGLQKVGAWPVDSRLFPVRLRTRPQSYTKTQVATTIEILYLQGPCKAQGGGSLFSAGTRSVTTERSQWPPGSCCRRLPPEPGLATPQEVIRTDGHEIKDCAQGLPGTRTRYTTFV